MTQDQDIKKNIKDLRSAVTLLDRDRVAELCNTLVGHLHQREEPLPVGAAKVVLGELRRKRFFGPLQRIADALVQMGQAAPVVRRQYAQALIDLGALTAAEAVLRELLKDTTDDPAEHAEAQGLLGRTYKQRYVDAQRYATSSGSPGPARNATVLRQAIRFYHEAYLENPTNNYWHGINAVACAARASRDGVSDVGVPNPKPIAEQILAGTEKSAYWAGTALEAWVALGNKEAAIGQALAYSQHPEADAFDIASTIRQLVEVWQLDSTAGMGEAILPILRDGLLRREHGSVNVSVAEARKPLVGLETVLGHDRFVSLDMYRTGLQRARTIARIGVEQSRGRGTGFLLRGEDLAERFKGRWMMLTNAHVVSRKPEHKPAVPIDEAVITFEALPLSGAGRAVTYRIGSVHWESGPYELDAALIELDRPVEGIVDDDRCDVAPKLPANDQKQRVYIIGHPDGGGLSFSIQDNLLLDYEGQWLHYRAPTTPGSSGSPIFNEQWRLIGIHHGGSTELRQLHGKPGTYAANEGIWLQAIRQALASA